MKNLPAGRNGQSLWLPVFFQAASPELTHIARTETRLRIQTYLSLGSIGLKKKNHKLENNCSAQLHLNTKTVRHAT